ncbi:MAG TPA: hypothetical protein VMY34_03790, partial [Acidimicrobiales bacterium]|nr:hypothetical protein [Acidimicrobiales bacterium]
MAVAVVSTAAAIVLNARVETASESISYALWVTGFLAFPIAGAVIMSQRPNERIGKLVTAIGVSICTSTAMEAVARALLDGAPRHPVGLIAAWASQTLWLPGGALLLIFLPLLFPTGHYPTARWRWLGRLGGAALVLATIPRMILAWQVRGSRLIEVDDAAALFRPGVLRDVDAAGFPAMMILSSAALVSLSLRYRRSRGVERFQLKSFVYAMVVTLALVMVGMTVDFGRLEVLRGAMNGIASAAPPLAILIAVLRFRLFEIDVVISKTIVLAGLATFVTGMYVAVVSLAGILFGAGGAGTGAAPVVATALVATAFHTIRERLHGIANRFVYGRRASPYEVLSAFARRLSETLPEEDALVRMAQLLAEGTGGRA